MRLISATLQVMMAALAVLPAQADHLYRIRTAAGGGPPLGAAAQSVPAGAPQGVAVDSRGTLYYADTFGNRVYRVNPSGNIDFIVGTGTPGFFGDMGPAAATELYNPFGVAVDAAGNIYIADAGNQRIRKVDISTGLISTIAGTGTKGLGGDGGDAASAMLANPYGVAVDASGNVFIADYGNSRVRKVDAFTGAISTVAGDTRAFGAYALALDKAGNLFFVDLQQVWRMDAATGAISAVWKNDSLGATDLRGIAVDGSGNLFVSVNLAGIIRKIDASSGVASTVARPSVSLYAVAVDNSGNIFVAEPANHRVERIDPSGGISTAAGNGDQVPADGSVASEAAFRTVFGVAVSASGDLFFSEVNGFRIRRVSASTGKISTVAGNGASGGFCDGCPATQTSLNFPFGLAVDASENLLIADNLNYRIRMVDASTGRISSVAGSGHSGFSGDGGPATSANLGSVIYGLAADAAGDIFIADRSNQRIRKVTVSTGAISTVAGNGTQGFSGDGGAATEASLSNPWGVAVDDSGNLYIADSSNHRIRRVDARSGIISTIAGNGTRGFSGDGGPAANASLYVPAGVAVDAAGNLFIADRSNLRIRRVDAGSGIISTIAGNGTAGLSGDGGPGAGAPLMPPASVAVDGAGNVYTASDIGDNIRALWPVPSLGGGSIVNAASNLAGPIAPGEVVILYGSGLGPCKTSQATADAGGLFGASNALARVLFNGIPAPVIYSGASQVSVVVPYNTSGDSASIQAEYQGEVSEPMPWTVAASAPGLFTMDSSGRGQAAAVNEDSSVNTAANPARPGSIIQLYATGEGQTSPSGVDGKVGSSPLPRPLLPVQATIDGTPAEVIDAHGAPGLVAGYMQVNVRVPPDARAGSLPVTISVGNVSSQSEVTIAVGQP